MLLYSNTEHQINEIEQLLKKDKTDKALREFLEFKENIIDDIIQALELIKKIEQYKNITTEVYKILNTLIVAFIADEKSLLKGYKNDGKYTPSKIEKIIKKFDFDQKNEEDFFNQIDDLFFGLEYLTEEPNFKKQIDVPSLNNLIQKARNLTKKILPLKI